MDEILVMNGGIGDELWVSDVILAVFFVLVAFSICIFLVRC